MTDTTRLIARSSALLLLLTACTQSSDLEEIKRNQVLIKSNQQEIQYNQKKILATLDALQEKLEKPAPAAAPRAAARPAEPDNSAHYAVPLGDSPAQGAEDAWVTIVEISEFQCPYCQRVGPTLAQVKKTYGDDVRFVFKHNPLPFHARAMPAAVAAECAREQGKFWPMHDLLFANQSRLEDAALKSYAAKAGVEMASWQSCFDEGRHKDRIAADQKLAASFGASGTPAFFINGRFLSGAQPYPVFEAAINEELRRAKASGIAKADYYAEAVLAGGDAAK